MTIRSVNSMYKIKLTLPIYHLEPLVHNNCYGIEEGITVLEKDSLEKRFSSSNKDVQVTI